MSSYHEFYLSGVLRHFQHCTGHITMGSWKGRGNQYIQFVRVLYCKLPTNGKQLPTFPLEARTRTKPQPQRWKARVLPLCHRDPHSMNVMCMLFISLSDIFLQRSNERCVYHYYPVFGKISGFQLARFSIKSLKSNTGF